jgi:hypothetical protein
MASTGHIPGHAISLVNARLQTLIATTWVHLGSFEKTLLETRGRRLCETTSTALVPWAVGDM